MSLTVPQNAGMAPKSLWTICWLLNNNWQYDDTVNIIYDETSGYYEGNRDPWEVARVLQNRIQLYLNEQK